MSYQDQDPRYRSGPYQTHNSNTPQQSGRSNPSSSTTQDAYPNYPSQQAYSTSSYPQPTQPSGPSDGYPSHADGRGPFPGPHSAPSYSQHDSQATGVSATYYPSRQPSYDPSVGSHPYARRDTSGGPSLSYSGTHSAYRGDPSVTSRADRYSGAQANPGSSEGYTVSNEQSQNWNAAGHDTRQDEGLLYPKGFPNPPASGHRTYSLTDASTNTGSGAVMNICGLR
ncbi:hypothetical protein BC827DRAFT_1158501 [Russula dissimulans]|nr:hypothetical protein BC827DRAFT_1158501 [Russula dissimulans]